MNQETARRMGQMLRQARAGAFPGTGGPGKSGGGGKGGPGVQPPNLGTILGGSGLVIALGLGGLAINSSLYNGRLPAYCFSFVLIQSFS